MKKRLLIIEDSPDLVFIYKDFLKEFDLSFALELAEIEPLIDQVDLVICDYYFNPHLSFEQVREIVGDRKPLILCSGEDSKVRQYGGVLKVNISKQLKPLLNDLLTLG